MDERWVFHTINDQRHYVELLFFFILSRENLSEYEPIMDQIVLIINTKIPYFYADKFVRQQILHNVSDSFKYRLEPGTDLCFLYQGSPFTEIKGGER